MEMRVMLAEKVESRSEGNGNGRFSEKLYGVWINP